MPSVIEFPDSAVFVSAISDPRFALAVAITILSGMVRGFSGFGSALVYVPLMSAVYEPRIAAATFLLIDFPAGLIFTLGVWRKAHWRDVLPLAAAAIFAAQFGTMILRYADPTALRWAISAIVATLVIVLASGWRYHGRPILIVTICVGLLAGLIGGAAQMSGPPVILYWLGSMHESAVVRANLIAYFTLFSAGSIAIYILNGLITAAVLALAIVLAPLHIAAMWAGGKFFRFASEKTYRRIAYAIIAISAAAAMPVIDTLIR